jgi:Bacterial PH domain
MIWLDERGHDHDCEIDGASRALVVELNGKGASVMPEDAGTYFDKKEQLDQIRPWLLETEKLYCVLDCKGAGTGFVAVADKRVLFYDRATFRKKKTLMSVPFSKITSVASVDEGRGLFGATSELIVKTGSEEFEFEFRGGDKARQAYKLIMFHVL